VRYFSPLAALCLAWIAGSGLVSCGGNSRRAGDESSSGGSSAGNDGSGGTVVIATGGAGTAGTGNPSGGAGGEPPLDVCEDNTDCVLRAKSCCGACEPSKVADFVAINGENDAIFDANRECDGIACGPCPEPDPTSSNGGYFVATCQANRCIAVDLRTTDVTACENRSDCRLRFGSSCCGCGGVGDIIAISSAAALSKLVCAEPPSCPDCVATAPDGVADCQAGRCVVPELSP
jgi:hypothetical protein